MPRSMESELSAALSPVEAPGQLWDRVNAALPTTAAARPSRRRAWPSLLMAAAIAALMTGGVLYLRAAGRAAAPDEIAVYAVQRHIAEGQSVTIVSAAAAPGAPGHIRTIETGPWAVSEWEAGGRRWAMVTSKPYRLQTCSLCHRA